MIVVCDINEIWRERPFAAMAGICPVLGVVPCDRKVAKKNPAFQGELPKGKMEIFPVLLPAGWASRTAALGQRILWSKIKRQAREMGETIDAVVVTSPHYQVLLRILPGHIKTVYYASDDYRAYKDWDNMMVLERAVVRKVDHSFFVSKSLADRARKEYGCAEKIEVSMNASEKRFLPTLNEALPVDPPAGDLTRPIAGVIGGINTRLDFDLMLKVAELPELGTLLLVGPLPATPPEILKRLLEHKRCVAVGPQPHDSLHNWFKCLDVGLIPYVDSELNKSCSPMRLFDHLAAGIPIVATAACDQVLSFPENVAVGTDEESYVGLVKQKIKDIGLTEPNSIPEKNLWEDRAQDLLKFINSGKDYD